MNEIKKINSKYFLELPDDMVNTYNITEKTRVRIRRKEVQPDLILYIDFVDVCSER